MAQHVERWGLSTPVGVAFGENLESSSLSERSYEILHVAVDADGNGRAQ